MSAKLSAGRRRRLRWCADGELHPCRDCLEKIFYSLTRGYLAVLAGDTTPGAGLVSDQSSIGQEESA